MDTNENMGTNENNEESNGNSESSENEIKWSILDVLLVLVFVVILTRIFEWLMPLLIGNIVITQKHLIGIVFQNAAIILIVVYFNIIKGVTWKEIGIRTESLSKVLKYGVFGGIFILALVVITGLITELIFPTDSSLQPFAEIVLGAMGYSDLIILLIIGAILVPIGEEIYFRGMVYPAFKKKWGLIAGMVISGAFFSLLHFDALRFLPLLLSGVVLAYIYEKSNSLFPCMLAHGLWNGTMIFLLYYSADYFAGF